MGNKGQKKSKQDEIFLWHFLQFSNFSPICIKVRAEKLVGSPFLFFCWPVRGLGFLFVQL